jgi:heat shock protein HslJ
MKKIGFVIVVMTGLVILTACGLSSRGEITDNAWILESLNGSPLEKGTLITAKFVDGKVSGSAGCNRYTGAYTVSGKEIQFTSPMASTMMACEQPIMDQETAYFQALATVKSFIVSGDQLTLKDSNGTVVASYTAQSQDLSGTAWLTTSINNGNQAVVSLITGSELTAEFGKDGTLSGSAGCNSFTGSYKVDGDKITIGPLASTMMACDQPEGVMDQEAQYLAALQSAATYSIEGNRLELRTADDAMAADFSKK